MRCVRFHLLPILACCLITQTCVSAERPNIVFAFGDDLGRYAGAYAESDRPSPSDIVATPNFDRLAREGVLFDCALAASPSCTPSRAAIVSCRHFFRNGSHAQLHHPWMKGYPDPWDEVRGFPLMLQDAGYYIGWSYKMHISEDRMGGSERNYRPAGSRFNSFSQQVMRAQQAEQKRAELLEEVRENFRAFLADVAADQPYFYWFNPTNTHRAWAQGSGRSIWQLNPDDLKGRLPSFLPDVPLVREDFADYLGEVMAFDAAVGVLLEELESRHDLENTIVVVSGDHGAPGFPRGKCNLYDFGSQVPLAIRWPGHVAAGRRLRTPVSLIDLGPTFLEAAQLETSDEMDGQSLLTAMDPDTENGESHLRGYAITGRENHVDEARPGGLPYPMRAIRTAEYLYVINFAPDRWPVAQPPLSAPLVNQRRSSDGSFRRRMDIDFGPTRDWFTEHESDPSYALNWQLGFGKRPAEELYKIATDPDQTHNLVDDANMRPVKDQLRQQLMRELVGGNDPRVTGDGAAFDEPPYAPTRPQRGVVSAPAP